MLSALKFDQKPIILFDDLQQQVGYLMAPAENADGQTVNFMAHEGKGLVYVCITKDIARKLELSVIEESEQGMAVSVDYKTSTTGISAYERADTIKAFTLSAVEPEDFKRPGHIFPLISAENMLLERTGIAEAAVMVARQASGHPAAYVCEILNKEANVATRLEVEQMSNKFKMKMITFSELLQEQYEQAQWLTVIEQRCLDSLNGIWAYTVNDELSHSTFHIYLNQYNDDPDDVVFYRPCEAADWLGLEQCKCDKHLPDYYSELVQQKISAIIVESQLHSNVGSHFALIKKQLKKLTHTFRQEAVYRQIANF
ncbi:3,4-dihydroxy-2-butanone-4-phosphate synthase [Halalkalibacter oceani]|uniref:3,4-dihydroxy-2-butanone-4-phosphate synthase n=1 Tax=Halalkalibacter oceani TaxID=1653776 RepID=UPI003393E005